MIDNLAGPATGRVLMTNRKEKSKRNKGNKRLWVAPQVASSDVFTKAALACCQDPFSGEQIGSSGAGLPFC